MKTACGYIRVSTDYQTEYSPDAQRRLIMDYCKNNDIAISNDDIFEDLGISGTKADTRPMFNQMIAACKDESHPYDMILVWKFSRFARNQEESILYKRLLRKHNVEVVSISEPIPEGFVGELIERIFEWMDEYYSINLSQEVKRGMRQRASKGYMVGKAPFGYDHIKGQIPTINEEQARVIRLIFNKYLEDGMWLVALVRWLNDNGYRTGANAPFNRNKVSYILKNPFYIGKIRWDARSSTMNTSGKYTPDNSWIIADGKHEPIIDEELFNKVQEKLAKNCPNIKKNAPRKHYLTGIIKCKCCGGSLVYRQSYQNGKRKQPAYMFCRRNNVGICPTSQRTRAEIIEKSFIEGLLAVVNDGNYVLVKNVENDNAAIKNLQEQIEKIKTKQKRIKDAYINGIDTIEEYKANKEQLQAELDRLTEQMDKLSDVEESALNRPTKAHIDTLANIIKSEEYSIEQKNESIRQIVEKVVYDRENQTMEYYLNALD